MSTGIYAGNLQRSGEYQTRGLRTLQGVRWSYQAQGHIHFPPLVAHGRVYVGSNDGSFYALDTHTEALQWRFETASTSLPVEKDDRMNAWKYTGVTSVQLTRSTAFFGTANGTIYRLDLETGQPTWQFLEEQSEEIFHVIVVDDLLLFWSKSGISAVNVTTKERLWEGRLHISYGEPICCPTIADRMLYCASIVGHNGDILLQAYDFSTKELVWQSNVDGPYDYIPAIEGFVPVVNGTAYFVAGVFGADNDTNGEEEVDDDESTCLVAVDALTGKLQWFYEIGDWTGTENGYTALANNLACVVKESGDIFAIDLTTHKARWTRQLDGGGSEKWYDIPSSLADGILYLPRRDGLLTALDALTGQDLWTVQLDGEITTPCTIADGVVYVAAGASVYALH